MRWWRTAGPVDVVAWAVLAGAVVATCLALIAGITTGLDDHLSSGVSAFVYSLVLLLGPCAAAGFVLGLAAALVTRRWRQTGADRAGTPGSAHGPR